MSGRVMTKAVFPQDSDVFVTGDLSAPPSAPISIRAAESHRQARTETTSGPSQFSETTPDDLPEEVTSGPLSRKSTVRSGSTSVGLVTPTSVNRTYSRKSGHRILHSARSGVTQFFDESESAFTTGISFDIGAVQAASVHELPDTAAILNELYGIDHGYLPKAAEMDSLRLPAYTYEEHISADIIDDICGISAYKQACLRRDVHPSAIVMAAIRRNPVNLNLDNIYLGPLGAQCLAAAIQGQLSKSMETLSLRNCKIGSNGLWNIAKSLLNLPDECITTVNYTIPEDEEGDHRNGLTMLNLSGNNLFEVNEFLTDSTGLPPLVTSEQITYVNHEYARIKNLLQNENIKKDEVVDPYLEMIRATALYNYGSNEPRPFQPPKKLTEDELKKLKAAGVDVTDVPPDPTFSDTLPFHQKLSKLHIITASQLINVIKHVLTGLSLLTTLDLSSNGLNDSFLKGSSKSLCAHASLTNLNLSGNCITESGIQSFVTELPNSINLERLDLSNNQFGSIGACILAYGLCKVMIRTSLRLSELSLSRNKIGDEAGAFVIGCFMGGFAVPEIMQHGMTTATDFMGTLPAPIPQIWKPGPIKPVSGITSLELSKCGLGIFSCLQLCKTLVTANTKIGTLDVSGNSLNAGIGFYSIVKALVHRKTNHPDSEHQIGRFIISNKTVRMDEIRQFLEIKDGDTVVENSVVELTQLTDCLSSMNGEYIKDLVVLPY